MSPKRSIGGVLGLIGKYKAERLVCAYIDETGETKFGSLSSFESAARPWGILLYLSRLWL